MRTTVLLLIAILIFSDFSDFLRNPFSPHIPVAEAATGDFAVFRENTGTETVPPSAQPTLDVSWDTTVQSNSNITLQGNNSDIDLADGGKYLVLYNVWGEQGTSTAGNQRRSHRTWLTVGGVASEYGWGSGYLRDSDNVLQSYNNGAAIIDANAGDDLQIHTQRDDQSTGGMNLRASTNGVTVLKLKDSWNYLRIHRSATTSDIDANTTFTAVDWTTADEVDTGAFGFTATSAVITLKGDDNDHFLVTANVHLTRTTKSANTRENYEMRLTLDGVEIPGTRVTTYPRGHQTQGDIDNATLVYSGIIQKNAIGNQTLNVEYRRESSSSNGITVIAGDKTALSIVALPDEGNYIMLTDSATTALASSRTGFDWDTQSEIDTYAFSHSTTSNPSEINIDTAGDYLFFSTMYAVNTSDDRQPTRIDWRKNGTTLFNYASHGAYLRGNQAFSGGSSGGLIMNGLSDTDFIEVTHFDETETPADATFQANRVAVQGILLDDNFFGVDVLVSATSSQQADISLPGIDFELGGAFVIAEQVSSRNITNITLTESGTVDGQTSITNIEMYYDLDTTSPYNCGGENFTGTSTETQFGSTDTNGFSGPNGVSSFAGSVVINTTQTFCGYVVYDVTASSTDGETMIISINDPTSDVRDCLLQLFSNDFFRGNNFFFPT